MKARKTIVIMCLEIIFLYRRIVHSNLFLCLFPCKEQLTVAPCMKIDKGGSRLSERGIEEAASLLLDKVSRS